MQREDSEHSLFAAFNIPIEKTLHRVIYTCNEETTIISIAPSQEINTEKHRTNPTDNKVYVHSSIFHDKFLKKREPIQERSIA